MFVRNLSNVHHFNLKYLQVVQWDLCFQFDQVVLVDQVVMGVRQAVVAILVPMDVRTTFHLVTQANISSTVAGIVDLLVQGVQVLAHNSLAWAWVHLVLRALLVRGPPAIILRGRHILQCLCPGSK